LTGIKIVIYVLEIVVQALVRVTWTCNMYVFACGNWGIFRLNMYKESSWLRQLLALS